MGIENLEKVKLLLSNLINQRYIVLLNWGRKNQRPVSQHQLLKFVGSPEMQVLEEKNDLEIQLAFPYFNSHPHFISRKQL